MRKKNSHGLGFELQTSWLADECTNHYAAGLSTYPTLRLKTSSLRNESDLPGKRPREAKHILKNKQKKRFSKEENTFSKAPKDINSFSEERYRILRRK
jgi:hypothetical protein